MNDHVSIKRAVEWKIFETQAALISEDAESGHLDLAKKWLLPQQYYDVVEERSSDGRCGFPLCRQKITSSRPGRLRLSYLEKKIYDDEMSSRYCSSSCIERSQIFSNQLDESSPFTRKCVATLQPVEAKGDIDSLLGVLTVENSSQEGVCANAGLDNHSPEKSKSRIAGSSSPAKFIEVDSASSPLSSPDKFSLADVDRHLHSHYTPSLLSYDPVHTVPPNHVPLASQGATGAATSKVAPTSRVEGIDRRPAPSSRPSSMRSDPRPATASSDSEDVQFPESSSSVEAHSPSKNSEVVKGIMKASSVTDLAAQDIDDGSPSVPRRKLKKSLSFGEDMVRLFKRGSKATALYTEQDFLEGRIPSNYSNSSDSDCSPMSSPLKQARHTTGSLPNSTLKVALESSSSTILLSNGPSSPSSSVDSDTDSSDFDNITPPFENQVKSWLSGGWDHGEEEGGSKAASCNPEGKCTVNKSLPRTYDPHPRIEPMGWAEPPPPPPVDLGMSAKESIKKVNEYKRIRKRSQREAREASKVQQQQQQLAAETKKPVNPNTANKKPTPPQRPPVRKKGSGPLPLGSAVVERGWGETKAGGVSPVAVTSSSAIEGYEPVSTETSDLDEKNTKKKSAVATSAEGQAGTDDEGDSDVGEVSSEDLASLIQVSAESSLSGLAFNPFKTAEPYTDDQRAEDEKILREISLSSSRGRATGEEDEDEEGGGELDAVTKRNFFGDMWMALEDMFGYDAISWLNGLEERGDGVDADDVDEEGDEEGGGDGVSAVGENVEEDGDDERDASGDKYLIDAHAANSKRSISTLLRRGISAAENVVKIPTVLSCDPVLLAKYSDYKNHLLRAARTGSANPSFNSRQWSFFGLLLIDAVLSKRVLPEHEDLKAGEATRDNWNSKFEAFAAGLLGGAEGVKGALSDREFVVLREFFDIELA